MMLLPPQHNFAEINNLVKQGDYDDALIQLGELEEQLTPGAEITIKIKLLKIYILILTGNFKKGLESAEEAVTLTQTYTSSPLKFDALILNAEALRNLGQYVGAEAIRHPSKYSEVLPENLPEFKKLVSQSEIELNKIHERTSIDYLIRKARFFRCKGIILRTEGKFEDSLDYLSTSSELFKKSNIIEGLAGVFSSIALTYGIMGDIEDEITNLKISLDYYRQVGLKREIAAILIRLGSLMLHYKSETKLGLEFINQSYHLSKEIEENSGIAVNLSYLGIHFTWLGELDRGLKFLQRSLLISENIGCTENLAFTLNNIGWNYHIRGELSLALESLNRSLTIAREKQYPWILVWILSNIGYVNQAQGKFDEACGYYTHSITVSTDIDDYLALSWGIYQVIKLNLDTKSEQYIIVQIMRLKELSSRYKVQLMSQMYRVAQGMLLKNSPRLKDKAKAQEYFEQVAKEKIESLEITADAMINQCELLLFEYKNSGSLEVLNDVQNLINKLLDISEEQNSHSLLSTTYMLKAELALLQEEISLAREYINKAQLIAEEKGLNKLALAISREHDKLLDHIGTIEGVSRTDYQLEIGEIEKLLGRMKTRNLAAVTEAYPEDPIMLLIIAEGGMTLYNHTFTSNEYVKGQLIGSFLSAIESFSQEVFSSPMERATLGKYRLVIQTRESLSFSYVFRGESYSAIKRLNRFIQLLETNKNLWIALKSKVDTGLLPTTDEYGDIKAILDKIFQ
ncbi:MAG: tetratricopeptide repeat protein [Candidatus Hodarchaeota archaeon]